jgi:hypothetical protein
MQPNNRLADRGLDDLSKNPDKNDDTLDGIYLLFFGGGLLAKR